MGILNEPARGGAAWADTRWSVIGALDTATGRRREDGWAYLVAAYERPMQEYVRRSLARRRARPCSQEEAHAVVQDFLGDCAAKGWLSRADPGRGPFRAFIQILLRRFVRNRVRYERAARRASPPSSRSLRLDASGAGQLVAGERADIDAFDRTWAEVAVERARRRLAAESDRYLTVIDDLIRTQGAGSSDLAAHLRMREQQVPVLRHRARRRFAALFEEELAATVGDEVQFREEWRALARYLP